MKKVFLLLTLVLVTTSCRHDLQQKLFVKYRDKNVIVNVAIDQSDFSKKVYFGTMKLVNLSDKKIDLPNSGKQICLKNNVKNYRIFLEYGGNISNQIASDILPSVESGEFFEHKISIDVGGDIELENLRIVTSKNLAENIVKDFSYSLSGCMNE